MKKYTYPIIAILFLVILQGCSGIKVVEHWKADDIATVKSKKALVIARTNDAKARKAFEDAVLKQLKANGVNAEVSYGFIPDVNPENKLTEAELQEAQRMIQEKGFSTVVISVLKDRKSTIDYNREGGYYAGATTGGQIAPYFYGFYGYYYHPLTIPPARFKGEYVEATYSTQESVTFVLETLIYDLDRSEDKQLVGVVTSTVEDPVSATYIANTYAKKVMSAFKK